MTQCRRTVLSETEARELFIRVLNPQTPGSLAMLLAHSAFETAHWKGMYNWNFGNQGGSGNDGNFRLEDCGITTPPGNPATFAAFTDSESGLRSMINLLRSRYSEAWMILLQGDDPDAYVRALKEDGYFTAPLAPYQKGVASLFVTYGGRPKAEGSPGSLPASARQHSTLRLGSRDEVREWQRIVGVEQDGIFGPVTHDATLQFQQQHGLVADGVVGPKTWNEAEVTLVNHS